MTQKYILFLTVIKQIAPSSTHLVTITMVHTGQFLWATFTEILPLGIPSRCRGNPRKIKNRYRGWDGSRRILGG